VVSLVVEALAMFVALLFWDPIAALVFAGVFATVMINKSDRDVILRLR